MMIYLDNNATTPLDPEVKEAMLTDLAPIPYNPSSITHFGRKAKALLLDAKMVISEYFQVPLKNIIFTSGATEGNNWLAYSFFAKRKRPLIITSPIEHPSVLAPIESLAPKGADIHFLPVSQSGEVSLDALETFLSENATSTSFVFLSLANSETGVLLDAERAISLCEMYDVPLLLDGVQALGKAPLPKSMPTAITFSSHKCHGPKGVGLVLLQRSQNIPPLFLGGMQQEHMRAGTENLAGILGFAKAIELIDQQKTSMDHMEALRNHMETVLLEYFPDIRINGYNSPRLVNTSNILFPRTDGENLLIEMERKGIIISLGSACSAGALEPSKVLLAMGLSKEDAKASVRLSLSRVNTQDEIDETIRVISQLYRS